MDDLATVKTEKRKEVLFVYVKKRVKTWVKAQAKKREVTESLIVDTLLTAAMERHANRKTK